MNYYYFLIPIIIGIVAGSFLVLYQPQSLDSKILTESNLIENGSPVLGDSNSPITISPHGTGFLDIAGGLVYSEVDTVSGDGSGTDPVSLSGVLTLLDT